MKYQSAPNIQYLQQQHASNSIVIFNIVKCIFELNLPDFRAVNILKEIIWDFFK